MSNPAMSGFDRLRRARPWLEPRGYDAGLRAPGLTLGIATFRCGGAGGLRRQRPDARRFPRPDSARVARRGRCVGARRPEASGMQVMPTARTTAGDKPAACAPPRAVDAGPASVQARSVRCRRRTTRKIGNAQDHAGSVRTARDPLNTHLPRAAGVRDFSFGITPLRKQADPAWKQ